MEFLTETSNLPKMKKDTRTFLVKHIVKGVTYSKEVLADDAGQAMLKVRGDVEAVYLKVLTNKRK